MHAYKTARAAAAPVAAVTIACDGREWQLSLNDKYVVQCGEQQLDALALIHNALPLAVGEYAVRVWTSRGLVELTYDPTRSQSGIAIETTVASGSLGLCGLSRCQAELNPCTRLLALEAIVLGLSHGDDDDFVPAIATVQLDHPFHGTVTLFSA